MKKENAVPFADAMAFHHQDGLPSAWEQAMKFAGEGGRLAIMPDIVAARLATKPGEMPWETYFTTLTAEYYGKSKAGNPILIVAHGIGPMATLAGIQKTYAWEYKDTSRQKNGGRITQEEFWDLEAGKYGEVSIIDLDSYCKRYQYPFIMSLRASEAMTDPVLNARFGPQTEQYVLTHVAAAREYHREKAGLDLEIGYKMEDCNSNDLRRLQHLRDGASDSDPYIITVGDASNCCYTFGKEHGHRQIEDGFAIAHLISTGGLANVHHEGNVSLLLDVGCHEWWNGVRLVGIKAGGSIRAGLSKGPDVHKLLVNYWKDLLLPVVGTEEVGFRGLVKIGDQRFTQYPKPGTGMDTHEPEYVVTSIETIGEPVLFRTPIAHYHGFFKFGVNEVEAIAPPGANAYFFTTSPENEWKDGNPTHQTCMVQFYKIETDTSKRMMRADQLARDYEKIMMLMKKQVETV